MNVDELLLKSIVTPTFHCVAIKPDAGSLRLLDSGDFQFVYIKGSVPYMQETIESFEEYRKITGCAAHGEFFKTDNIGILMQYLKLAESARPKDGKRVLDPQKILSICYTYGLPLTQTQPVEGKGLLMGFSLKEFINRLDNLYIGYALWKALQIDEYNLIRQIWPHRLTNDEMQIEFENRLQSYINLHVVYKNNEPQLLYQAENIMALVEAQLIVLASKGDDFTDGSISYCADCGQPFMKYRSNSTLCEDCKGNTGKSRRRRARRRAEMEITNDTKKKGAVNNG